MERRDEAVMRLDFCRLLSFRSRLAISAAAVSELRAVA